MKPSTTRTTKYCEGCNIYGSCKWTDDYNNCPCIKCLVKMVCETGCVEYDNFEHNHRIKTDEEYRKHLEYQGKVMAR